MSRSSREIEYHALATTAAELSWLRILFKELRIFLSHVHVIWCDNVSAIALSVSLVFHSRTKHRDVDYHFTLEKILCKQLQIGFVFGKENFADLFTKSLLAPFFHFHHVKLLVDSSPLSLRGDVEDNSTRPVKKKKCNEEEA